MLKRQNGAMIQITERELETMISDNSFNMINLAADSVEVGLKQTVKAVCENKAAKVFLAEDCEDRIRETVKDECKKRDIQLISVPTMRLLGRMCGIDVKASCAAVLRK